MTDYPFDTKLQQRQELVETRDHAEEQRKVLDDEMRPHLAILGGRYEGPEYGATLVDTNRVTYDHDSLRKALLMAGVGMDVIEAAYQKARKESSSTSVKASRRG